MKRRTFFGVAALFVRLPASRAVTVTTFGELRAALLAGRVIRFPAGVVIDIPMGAIE